MGLLNDHILITYLGKYLLFSLNGSINNNFNHENKPDIVSAPGKCSIVIV